MEPISTRFGSVVKPRSSGASKCGYGAMASARWGRRSLPDRCRANLLLRLASGQQHRQRSHANAEQPDPALERHALKARPRGVADRPRILRGFVDRMVACHGSEVVVAQLDADRPAHDAVTLQVVAQVLAE